MQQPCAGASALDPGPGKAAPGSKAGSSKGGAGAGKGGSSTSGTLLHPSFGYLLVYGYMLTCMSTKQCVCARTHTHTHMHTRVRTCLLIPSVPVARALNKSTRSCTAPLWLPSLSKCGSNLMPASFNMCFSIPCIPSTFHLPTLFNHI
jgi:hypothetical protein